MKEILKYLKVTMAALFISSTLLSTNIATAQAEEVGEEAVKLESGEEQAGNETANLKLAEEQAEHQTANLDFVEGRAVRMQRTSTGVVVDGHQLNHDYVKILNVNNGNIVINDESYTQGSVSEPWSTQEDAYVIKGTGTSVNNITIAPTSNEITVYLVDLEWNGQLVIGGSSCKVNVVICGNIKNLNATCFINVNRSYGSLFVTGLTEKEDTVTANVFFYHYFYPTYVLSRTVNLKNITINSNKFYNRTTDSGYYDSGELNFDNVVLNNNSTLNIYGFNYINIHNSYIKVLDVGTSTLTISNSKIGNISTVSTSLSATNSEIENISAAGSTFAANNSFLNFNCLVNGVINAANTTINLNSASQSSLSKINLDNCSLFSAVKFVGTPVDNSANDLFVKKIRIRQFPNTYVWLSIDNGAQARLKTDANGYLYPYVKKGTTRVDARLEDGQKFYATFPSTTGTDNTTTNLLLTAQSTPSIISFSPSKQVNIGETLSLYITANPGTAGRSLSYQWYKNDVLLSGDTQSTLTRNEAVTNDSGIYKCVVKEDGGSTATSDNIEVIVSKLPVSNTPLLLTQTSEMNLSAGDSVTLIVSAAPSVETNTLSYQWYQNNTPIAFTDSRLTLSNITASHAGSYKCVITEENFNTTVESAAVNISVR